MRTMKDSGIEWIGEIPEEWFLTRIASLFDVRNEKVSDKVYTPLSVTKSGIVLQLQHVAKTNDNDNRKLVCAGDFIINSRSDRKCSSGLSPLDGSVSLINIVLFHRKQKRVNGYWGHLLHSLAFAEEFYSNGHGIVTDLWTTSWSEMKSISIPLPPLEEQQRIADYLDQKCAEIDQAIASAEQSIQEYGEYKQSLIFQTTTKGLDPSVPMIDSGIEWIGEIPSSWKVGRLKSMLSLSRVTNRPDATVLSLYRDYGIIPKDSRDDNHNVTSLDTTKYKFVEVGDFVINKMKAWQGSMALSAYEGIVSPAYHVLKFVSSRIEPRYAHMILRTKPYAQEWDRLSTGLRVGQWDLHVEDFLNTCVPLPTIEEQQRIADYLDQKCAEIDQAIEAKKSIIEELKSYKQSLIFEVTTGKKEV